MAIGALSALAIAGPLAWHRARAQWLEFESRPRPIVASDAETRDIVRAVLAQHEYLGAPHAPPAPHESPAAPPKRVLVLRNESVCFADEPRIPDCPKPEFFSDRDIRSTTVATPRLREELISANRTVQSLALEGIAGTHIIDAAVLDKLLAGDAWWEDFYARYPGAAGFIELSVPVLSDDRTRALIYVSHYCDGLCGTGYLFVLQRTPIGWEIRAEELAWIS